MKEVELVIEMAKMVRQARLEGELSLDPDFLYNAWDPRNILIPLIRNGIDTDTFERCVANMRINEIGSSHAHGDPIDATEILIIVEGMRCIHERNDHITAIALMLSLIRHISRPQFRDVVKQVEED
jgi:hypothetical protein